MIPTLTYCLDILFDILSGIVSGILFGMCSGPGVPSCIRSWQRRSKQQRGGGGEGGGEEEGEGLEGVAPLLKSRDPHLADGEKTTTPAVQEASTEISTSDTATICHNARIAPRKTNST